MNGDWWVSLVTSMSFIGIASNPLGQSIPNKVNIVLKVCPLHITYIFSLLDRKYIY